MILSQRRDKNKRIERIELFGNDYFRTLSLNDAGSSETRIL